jgi:ABC-type transport system substrate-binding protein
MNRRRVLAGAAVTATGVFLAASLGGARAGEGRGAKEGGTFRVVTAGGFFTIDPALAGNGPAEGPVLRPTCAGLLDFPDKALPAGLRVEPDLAEAQPVVSKDGKTYTFRIRKDARFSDGTPVTARNFLRAFERIFDPSMNSSAEAFFDIIVGATEMLDGKTKTPAGVSAAGRTLTVKLTRRVADFPMLVAGGLCAVPANLKASPDGATAPLPSPAPYYVSEYVPDERVVLERNRYYKGPRPQHVDRFTVDIGADPATVFNQVLSGEMDYALGPPQYLAPLVRDVARRYGVNKSQFFVVPHPGVRSFMLNTSRPLFKENVKLRQAINFAIDRRALTRELGPYAGSVSDQFMPPNMPGYRDARIYPLDGPDLRKARALASGRKRSGRAVLYTLSFPADRAQAQILRRDLAKIGIALEIKEFPLQLLFEKLSRPDEPFDIGRVSWGGLVDPGFLAFLFNGRNIGRPDSGNWSYFNSAKYNRLLDRALALPVGRARSDAFGKLDVQISRDAAPAIAYGVPNQLTLVSRRTGCVVVNPDLDLTAVCLK